MYFSMASTLFTNHQYHRLVKKFRFNTCVLMDSSFCFWYNKLGMIYCINWVVNGYIFKTILYALLYFRMFFGLANSADVREMSCCAAFHQGFHCLPKNAFKSSYKYTKRRNHTSKVICVVFGHNTKHCVCILYIFLYFVIQLVDIMQK